MSAFKEQEQAVSGAFSAQSPKFDAITTTNPMEVIYRDIVRAHVCHYIKPGQRMLELNCGTGLDAVFFAGKGQQVHATDNSEGMLAQLKDKVEAAHLQDQISWQKCSYNQLELGEGQKFDHVFSNFGGLNCTDNLESVVKQLDNYLHSGSMVHFVLIAPLCPWEWLTFFKGKFKFAFRRLRKGGVRSHLEGHYFTTYYYQPGSVKAMFGKGYRLASLRSLGCLMPPTFNDYFPARRPRLFKALKSMELEVNTSWPFNRFGDLFIISLTKR